MLLPTWQPLKLAEKDDTLCPPDIIAIKDGKVTAIEIERGTNRNRLTQKYANVTVYDSIILLFPRAKAIACQEVKIR